MEDPKKVSNEFFDFHDKVNKVLEVINFTVKLLYIYIYITGPGRNLCYPHGRDKGIKKELIRIILFKLGRCKAAYLRKWTNIKCSRSQVNYLKKNIYLFIYDSFMDYDID